MIKQRLKQIIIKKNIGSITSLIIGQMLMLVLLIWCLFNFRLTLINTVFNYLDDAFTSSILGGALVNVEEYGKSNQLIIHNNDVYNNETGNSTYNGWEKFEADILLSELNYGSDITLSYAELERKTMLNKVNRGEDNNIDTQKTDYYLRRSLSAFMGNFTYNLSNGKANSEYNASNIVDNVSGLGGLYPGGNNNLLVLNHDDVLGKSFMGQYIVGDIEITRLDVYSVYRTNLAKKHKYMSDYIGWTGDTPKWKGPKTESEFDTAYKPKKLLPDGITENENYAEQLDEYKKKLYRWKIDKAVAESGQPLICYTNTATTFQGEANSELPYKHFFSQNGNNDNLKYTSNADQVTLGKKAPISGYSIYSYKSGNSSYHYSPGTTFNYKSCNITQGAGTVNDITISDGKMDGIKIENTSIYVELTFTVKTLPGDIGLGNAEEKIDTETGEKVTVSAPGKGDTTWGTQKVTVARLIDIELKTN